MSLDKARGFTKKALAERREARALEAHNPSRAKAKHKAASKSATQATIQRENVRGKPKKK